MPRPDRRQSENAKDWGSITFGQIYFALASAGMMTGSQDEVCSWLNNNGFCNLTCCPNCHVDDFVHVEGCILGDALEKIQANVRQNSQSLMDTVLKGVKARN